MDGWGKNMKKQREATTININNYITSRIHRIFFRVFGEFPRNEEKRAQLTPLEPQSHFGDKLLQN